MKGVYSKWRMILTAIFCIPLMVSAQVEESAEITTEIVEDVFQENFFEALKQKGIGNYDKALNYLVQCKELDPEEPAVDYEMGRIYMLTRQYTAAEDHLLRAVKAVPSNVWYLNETVHLYLEQQELNRAIVLAEAYAEQGWEQKLILADLHIKNRDPDKARELIDQVENSYGAKAEAAGRRLKLALEESDKAEEVQAETGAEPTEEGGNAEDTPDNYREELKMLSENKMFDQLLLKSTEAVSNFPAQPEFYYYRAFGLVKTGDHEQALAVAEEGLAYLLDDKELEIAFYRVMKEAYTHIGNEEKVKEIENRIQQIGN